MSLSAQSVMVKERVNHLPVVLFTKENIYADKPVPVVNLPPVMFIGAPTRQGIIVKHTGRLLPRKISGYDHHGGCTSVGGFV